MLLKKKKKKKKVYYWGHVSFYCSCDEENFNKEN